MKIFRFMSLQEFFRFIDGDILKNTTQHFMYNNTSSRGFCFLNLAEYKPEEAYHFLFGLIDSQICAVFETDVKNVRQTWGKYHKPTKNYNDILNIPISLLLGGNSFLATEYCTIEYSNKNFKLLKYAVPDWNNRENWKWEEFNELQITKKNKEFNGT